MAAGYTRQAAANISAGLTISAADHNAEYNQIQAAFDGSTGHDHTGGSGLGPKISLTGAVSGILPVANGGSGSSSFAAGSVIFSNGTIFTQDNASFFWDNTNNYLGIGTAVPAGTMHLHTPSAASTKLLLTNSTTGATVNDGMLLQVDSTGIGYVWNWETKPIVFGTSNFERMRIHSSGNVSIGNTTDAFQLHVTGVINAVTGLRVNGTPLAASNLSNGTTGTGSVMLATSPTTTGTMTANAINAASIALTGAFSAASSTISGALSANTFSAASSTISGALSANTLSLTTDLPITEGGTGASTQATAFANIAVITQSLANPGYIKLANGLILQWGIEVLVAATTKAVTFPLGAFPSSVLSLQLSHNMSAGGTMSIGHDLVTTSGFTINMSSAYTGNIYWFALGI